MKKPIQIPEGNEFSLFIPFVVFSKSGREDASAALWNDLQVVVRMSNSTANVDCTYSVQAQYVVVSFGNDLKRSSYDVIISGEYEMRKVCAPLNNHFAITAWADGNYADFIVGQPIICPTQTIIGQFNTTQDIEDLTEELRDALAAAEAAKEDYEEKVAEIENVAQQGTNPDATNTAILTAIGNISIDTTTIAKQGNNPNTDLSQVASDVTDLGTALNQAAVILAKQGTNASATLTATQTAATNAYASAEAAKTATVDGNDTAVGVAKEIRGEVGTGSDTAAETGTLFAIVKWVKDKLKAIQGTNASATNTAILQAIADNAGVPMLTIPNTTATQELAPNTCYIFENRSNALLLTLGSPIVGIANEYHFFIVTDTTAPTIIFPTGITWNGGSAPTIAASKTYEISILNNVAAYFEV